MKTFLRILTLVLLTNYCNAQFSNNIWCFGDSAGLDFSNATNPIAFTTAVNSRGSCVSIADSANHLLFYAFTRATLGGPTTLVYNANNQLMQNGDSIVGEGWYQELVIVPYPSNTALFYLFSISITGSSGGGLYYSTIDMSQNGGLGAVMQKNIPLDTTFLADDCIAAIKHANGRDWWLFYRDYSYFPVQYNNAFYTYLITPNGISNKITNTTGPIAARQNGGVIKFNSAGNQFVYLSNIGQIDLFDFNRCSGTITHNYTIETQSINPPWHLYFGCVFSPSGKYLYVADFNAVSSLYQFDLSVSNITASRIVIDSFSYPLNCGGQLKLAPDNKIYMSNAYNDGINFNYPYADTVYNMYNMNLSVINQPDSAGLACNFTKYSFYLGGNRTYWGLPNNPDYTLGPVVGSLCDTLTGIAPLSFGEGLGVRIFPNPVNNYFTLKVQQVELLKNVSLFSLIGEKVIEQNVSGYVSETTINVAKLPKGIYLVKVETNRGIGYRKLVKQ